MSEYRNVRVRKIGSHWYAVISMTWDSDHPVRLWHKEANATTGLGGPAAMGHLTQAALRRAIDRAIARCGPVPSEVAAGE